MDAPTLSPQDLERFGRQIGLPEIGAAGQQRLRASSVLCVGVGGLGSPAALYLAAAGVGRIGIVDDDTVALSNLHRQLLHATEDVGRAKTDSAARRLRALDPDLRVDLHATRLRAANVRDILSGYEVVVDGSDNFATRYLVNDACILLGRPDVYGSVARFEGQATLFGAPGGPCYRCLYPEPPPPGTVPDCATAGVLGVVPGLVGIVQATEALKWLLGMGESLAGRLLRFDARSMRFSELRLERDPACPLCGDNPSITHPADPTEACGAAPLPGVREVSPEQLRARLAAGERIVLLDIREPFEAEICRLEGSVLIPPAELERRIEELDPARETVVYCRTGPRAVAAARRLAEAGFERVSNLAGGIRAWAEWIDPSMPTY